jgi:hypothetical protein
VSIIARPNAHSHEAVSAGVAPSARAAWKTMIAELVKPTRTATKPATTEDIEKSRRTRNAHPSSHENDVEHRTTTDGAALVAKAEDRPRRAKPLRLDA